MPARLFKMIADQIPTLVHALDSMEGFSYSKEEQEDAVEEVEEEEEPAASQDWNHSFYTPPPKKFCGESIC